MSVREGTPLPSGRVRFAFEAGFIILVGAIAAVLELRPVAIVLVMGLAWVAVVLVERAAKTALARPRRVRERPPMPVAAPSEDALRHPPAPPEPSKPQARRRRSSEPRAAVDLSTREWNLWELERRAREHAGADAVPEEWAAIFMSLREYAKSDGRLPPEFDSLVRESFPELTRVA
jgi:hypothetical protein